MTDITVILDKSLSMKVIKQSTVEGFNEFLKEQRELKGKANLSLVQFATRIESTYENTLKKFPRLTLVDKVWNRILEKGVSNDSVTLGYSPDGTSTALYDAIGKTLDATAQRISGMKKQPDKVLIAVITDGQENDSHDYSAEDVKAKINYYKERLGWEFAFIGANQDSFLEGGRIGIERKGAMNFEQSDSGVRVMYASLSSSVSDYREKGVFKLSDD